MKIERRYVHRAVSLGAARAGQVRRGAAAGSGPGTLTGYAALYNVETVIAGYFRELIEPGAFDRAIQEDDVRALLNHDANLILGRTVAKTLTLSSDATGLRYDVTLPDTSVGRDLAVSVGRGDISQSSFAFAVDVEEWENARTGGLPLRRVREARLFDVSPVTYPAYEETTVTIGGRALEYLDTLLLGLELDALDADDAIAHIAHTQRMLRPQTYHDTLLAELQLIADEAGA